MSDEKIDQQIRKGNFASALQSLEEKAPSTASRGKISICYYAFKALNDYCYENRRNGEKISQLEAQEIYHLANFCCEVIMNEQWACKKLPFMQCLYHIHKYLVTTNLQLSKRLCDYYFKFKEDLGITSWKANENLIFSNIINDYSIFLTKNIVKMKIFGNTEASVTFWISYILKIIRLRNSQIIFSFCTVLTNILKMIRNTKETSKNYVEFCQYCYQIVNEVLEGTNGVEIDKNDFTLFTLFIDVSVNGISDTSELKNYFENISKCINSFTKVAPFDVECLNMLDKCMAVCLARKNNTCDILLDELIDLIEKKWSQKDSNVIFTVHTLLFQFRVELTNNTTMFKNNLPKVVKMFSRLSDFFMQNLAQDRNLNVYINVVYSGVYFVPLSQEKESLITSFETLKKLFINFASVMKKNPQVQASHFSFGVAGIVNAFLAYKKNELFKECQVLSSIIFRFFLSLPQEQIGKLKPSYINFAISTFALSCSKVGLFIEAQMGLIAFATVHKDFSPDAFKSWAEMKITSSHNLDSTVACILDEYGEQIEKHWPPFKLEDADRNLLLFYEVRSYAITMKVDKNAVLSAYRTAAKLVTDQTMLASILICVVDYITVQPLLPKLTNFEKSIHNFIQRFNQMNNTNQSTINLLLGNLHYQILRCELLQLRKKAEEEVLILETKPKIEIPILYGDQGDELDDTSFAPAFVYLQPDTQASIVEKLEEIKGYWEVSLGMLNSDVITSTTMKYIKSVGYMCRLYKFKQKEAEIWELLYKFGAEVSNFKYKTIAMAELLIVKSSVSRDITNSIKSILQTNTLPSNHYVRHIFYTNLARNAYYNGNVDECLNILSEVTNVTNITNYIVRSQYNIILSLAKHAKGNKEEVFPKTIVQAFLELQYLIKNGMWSCYSELCVLQWIVLETSELLGNIYNFACDVRSARCFIKDNLQIAQRLALPLRVCDLLSVFGRTDLICCDVIECDMKLRALEIILELKSLSANIEVSQNPSSPSFKEKVRAEPHFFSRELPCASLCCTNIDYQMKTLDVITLRALSLVIGGSHSAAKTVFEVGHRIVKFLDERNEKAFFTQFAKSKVQFYVALCRACTIWQKYDKAIEYTTLALNSLDVVNAYLKYSIMCLRNHIIWIQTYNRVKAVKEHTNDRFLQVPLPNVKTPELAMIPNEITSRTKPASSFVTPMPHRRRKLIFNDGELDNESPTENKFIPPPTNDVEIPVCLKDAKFVKSQLEPKMKAVAATPIKKPKLFSKAYTDMKVKQVPLGFKKSLSCVKPRLKIQVYCDDDDDTTNSKAAKPPVNRNLLAVPPSTSVKKSKPKTLTLTEKVEGRRLIFNQDEKNSDEDVEHIGQVKKSYSRKNKEPQVKGTKYTDLSEHPICTNIDPSENKITKDAQEQPGTSKSSASVLFDRRKVYSSRIKNSEVKVEECIDLTEDTLVTQQATGTSEKLETSVVSDDPSIIETTPPEATPSKNRLNVLPLSREFSKLTLSTNKSKKKQKEDNPIDETPRLRPRKRN